MSCLPLARNICLTAHLSKSVLSYLLLIRIHISLSRSWVIRLSRSQDTAYALSHNRDCLAHYVLCGLILWRRVNSSSGQSTALRQVHALSQPLRACLDIWLKCAYALLGKINCLQLSARKPCGFHSRQEHRLVIETLCFLNETELIRLDLGRLPHYLRGDSFINHWLCPLISSSLRTCAWRLCAVIRRPCRVQRGR